MPLLALFRFLFSRFSPLFALFCIWLSQFFAFICVISHLTFAVYRLCSRLFAFNFRVFVAFIRVISHMTFAFIRLCSRYFAFDFRVFRLYSRYSAFDFCVISPLPFAFLRIWLLRFLPLFALFCIWLLRFFAFDFRVLSLLTSAIFCLYLRYFAFDFCVFRLYLRYFAFNCVITLSFALLCLWILCYYAFFRVITPFNLTLLRIYLRFNAFSYYNAFGVIIFLEVTLKGFRSKQMIQFIFANRQILRLNAHVKLLAFPTDFCIAYKVNY